MGEKKGRYQGLQLALTSSACLFLRAKIIILIRRRRGRRGGKNKDVLVSGGSRSVPATVTPECLFGGRSVASPRIPTILSHAEMQTNGWKPALDINSQKKKHLQQRSRAKQPRHAGARGKRTKNYPSVSYDFTDRIQGTFAAIVTECKVAGICEQRKKKNGQQVSQRRHCNALSQVPTAE